MGTRHSHRKETGISKKRGGARKKGEDVATVTFIHPDAASGRVNTISNSLWCHRGDPEQLDVEETEDELEADDENDDEMDRLKDDFEAEEKVDNVNYRPRRWQ